MHGPAVFIDLTLEDQVCDELLQLLPENAPCITSIVFVSNLLT